MSRAMLIIHGDASRQKAMHWASRAPLGTRVEFKDVQRTLPQNDRMWAMLTDVATQVLWAGKRRTPDTWKLLFLDYLRRELAQETEYLPALDGSAGQVSIGTSSSDLSKDEMTMLIELVFKFGAAHGVKFLEPAEVA